MADDINLEDWIERDPSLVLEGIVMVGRQMQTAAGWIDLLGIDPAGRWVVIAVKKGAVRKETFTQAIDYAKCISDMDEDELLTKMELYLKPRKIEIQTLLAEHQIDDQVVFGKREVLIFIVGTGSDQPLEPLSKAPSYKNNPVQFLSFDLSANDADEPILVRKAVQPDIIAPSAKVKKTHLPLKQWPSTPAIERLLRIAAENGIGDDFRLIHEHAIRHGMYPRTYRWSIMYAPPQNKTRCLICVWSKREKGEKEGVVVYIASEAFAEFYPIQAQEVAQILGANHWERIPLGQADHFASVLDKLFEQISGNY